MPYVISIHECNMVFNGILLWNYLIETETILDQSYHIYEDENLQYKYSLDLVEVDVLVFNQIDPVCQN